VVSVTLQNLNLTGGAYLVLDGQTISINDSIFSGVTGSNRHVIYGASMMISNLAFSDSSSSGHFLSFQPSITWVTNAILQLETVSFSNCNTTNSASSIMVVQSASAKTVNAGGLLDLSFVNCNSKAALYLTRCLFKTGASPFEIVSSISGMTVTGGSTFKGLIALESTSSVGTILHTTDGLHATGVDFNSGAVYTLSNAGVRVMQNTALVGDITICDSSNLNYIAACSAVSGAPVYLDYALIKGTYAGVAIDAFNACTNTTLDIGSTC
jgi:hypothetical protein